MESDRKPKITAANEQKFLAYMQRGFHEWLKSRPDESVLYGAKLEQWALDYIKQYRAKAPNLINPVHWVMASFGATSGDEKDPKSRLGVIDDGGWGGQTMPLETARDSGKIINVCMENPYPRIN